MKTLLAGLKQKFLVHPVDIVEADVTSVKTDVVNDIKTVEAEPAKIVDELKQGM